ncbi:hypothetical protein D6789_04525 [Candidatus Woesearchaeota archaeon]|nr:MAG: hypothetical protein D6789_04525 [Candidatus Woesearchaeota archaeon]
MELKEELEKVTASEEFSAYTQEVPDARFVHAFRMYGQGDNGWQFGFYSAEKDKIVVFTAEPITRLPDDDVFSKTQPEPLNIEEVKTAPDKAIAAAKELMKNKYPAETAKQIILILQHLTEPVYNLTLVSHTLNFLNVRVSAATGEILTHELRSIMSLKR